jgi:transposase
MAYDDLQGIDWSWLSMDGCMTKAPLGGEKTGKNPTDRGKKGVKRSLLVEANGIPVGVAVEGANRNDMKMVEATLESIPEDAARPEATPEQAQGMCLDKGYDDDEVRGLLVEFGFTAHIKARGEEAQEIKRKAGHKARRWVVERTHSWMNRFRGVLIRWSKKAENYIALLHMCFAFIIYRRMGLSG